MQKIDGGYMFRQGGYGHDCKGKKEKLEAGDKGKMRGGGGELAMVI